MLLETHTGESVVGKAFLVFGAFWVVVIVGLYVGVGALMGKGDRALAKRGQHPPH